MFKDLDSEICQYAVFVVERLEGGRDGYDIFRVVEFVFESADGIGGAIDGGRLGDGSPFKPTGGETVFDIHFIGWRSVFGYHFIICGCSCFPSTSCICKRISRIFERGDARCFAGW